MAIVPKITTVELHTTVLWFVFEYGLCGQNSSRSANGRSGGCEALGFCPTSNEFAKDSTQQNDRDNNQQIDCYSLPAYGCHIDECEAESEKGDCCTQDRFGGNFNPASQAVGMSSLTVLATNIPTRMPMISGLMARAFRRDLREPK